MKRAALIFAAAAMTMTGTVASAQSYDRYDRRGGPGDSYGANRFDNRGGAQRWQRGQRLPPQYRSRDRVVTDYNRYRLTRPPRGYSYYRSDTGDILLAAIATGLIASVVAGAFSGDSNPGYGQQGYRQPYQSYGQSYGQGYGQPYGQSYGQTYGQGYAQPSQGYNQPYSSYGSPDMGYASPYQGYGQPSYGAGARIYRDAQGRAYTVDASGRSVWVQ